MERIWFHPFLVPTFEFLSMSRNQPGGGAHIGTATFRGGVQTFGGNSTVNNIRQYVLLHENYGKIDINQITDTNELKKIQSVVNLPRAQAGRKDYETKKKSGACFPGTRKALLREMMDWIINPGNSRMYALSGLAGIGKSTVVYTVAAEADRLGVLGASFFFSRDEADRRTAKKFFTTIAYQLCLFNEEFAQAIAGALVTERGFTAITGSPKEQLEALILDPLHAIVTPNTPQTLIVVDALDECDDEDAPSVLSGLRQIIQAFPSFKVILTTRPQPLVKNDFTSQDGQKIFYLQDIEEKVVNEDIRLYLRHSLSLEQVREQLQDPTEQWCASDGEIEILVQAAGKLFIIAATIVRFVLDKTWLDPADKMEELLRAFAQNRTPFDNLHEFYNIILRRAIPAGCRDTRVPERYQAVVGTIMLTPVSLSINTIAALTGVKEKQVFAVLRQLQSIISVGSDNIPAIYHKSFVDYITDSTRCKDVCLLIDPGMRHTWIAIRCFQLMQQHLKYNILNLGKPAQYMNNEDGLAKDGITNEQLEEKIPEYLRYACVYWANHLKVANIDNTDLVKELERFADQRMLHWFEVLSLIGKLDMAYRAILVALKASKSTSSDSRQLLSDGLRFIGKFYEIITRSALHTYHSGLAFTPTDSLLYRRYIKSSTWHIIGGPNKWDALVATVNHGERVSRVQFSLDSTMFVSWSEFMLKIWDAVTGTPISIIRGSCFVISNDFSTVASIKDNTITLYNVNGSERGTTITTQAKITKLAISPKTIAAGLSDRTLCLWDRRNDELIGCFDDCLGYLEFSATGARLVYRSTKDILKLRDGIDGRLIANLDCESSITFFAFSGDGDRIATLSKFVLKLWSCDGELVGITKDAGHYCLAISTNGSILATRDYKGTVKLWSGNSGNPLLLIETVLVVDLGETWHSIAFSPDDTLAIAAGNDIKLYNVKSHSIISKLPFRDCHELAFSPDCSRLVGVDNNDRTYLVDIYNLETPNSLSNKKPSDKNTALALSRDCSRLACGYGDGAVELWEIDGLTKQRIVTHRDHTNKRISMLQFSPDGMRFASASWKGGTIVLWEGKDGARFGTLRHRMGWLNAIEVSNSVLAAVGDKGIVLWDSVTLDHIHTFSGYFGERLSFSANGALLAATDYFAREITVFDVTQHTRIATFEVPTNMLGQTIHGMAFVSHNSQLLIQFKTCGDAFNGISHDDKFLAFNLVDKQVPQHLTFEDISHFLNLLPLWNGVAVRFHTDLIGHCSLQVFFSQHEDPVNMLWVPGEFEITMVLDSMTVLGCRDGNNKDLIGQCSLQVFFPQHDPVNMLWVPREFVVTMVLDSMTVLGCRDGDIFLMRLPANHIA